MNIVIASRKLPTYLGGLAKYQVELARALASAGHQASLLGVEGAAAGDAASQPLLRKLTAHEKPRYWSRMASRPWLHSPLIAWIVRAYESAIREIVATKPDVIHYVGTGWDYTGFAMAEASRRAKARFTIWPAVHPKQWGDDTIDIRLYQWADAVFVQSDNERNHLSAKGVDPNRLVRCGLPPMCLPNGNGRRLRDQYALGDKPLVLYLGRRDEGKGYFALLKAWSLLRDSCPEARLILAGPPIAGPNDLSIDLPDGAIDLGALSEHQKADALAACDVFCLPSAHESFGIVYLEAWSYGKPVICGTAPASRELVRDGETGLWTDQNPANLARVISTLLQDANYRRTLGLAGLALQQQEFTWNRILNNHLNAFNAR